jgi:UDP-glucose:(heptosyl)LPS alpha-1,3-glucosyltransferase
VRRSYALDEPQLPILFNAVDLQRYDPAARPDTRGATRAKYGATDGDSVALFIGQDFERKGLWEAVSAVGHLHASDPRAAERLVLLIVGKQRAAKYQALAKRLGVERQVVNVGPTDDAYAAYRGADFLVLPTKHDPCSLVVLEALAMGVPVISTRFNGACEIMTDGVHGFVLEDPNNVAALADATRKLLDPARRRRMAEACLGLRPRLAYEKHLRTLTGIYRKVMETRDVNGLSTRGVPQLG